MKFRKLALVATALLLPLSAVACSSDDSTGDLDTGDMSQELQDAGLPKEQADCMAKALKDADLSKEDLEKMSKGDSSAMSTDQGKKYVQSAMKCVTSEVSVPE